MTRGEILVADDDASIRTVVAQALSRAGYWRCAQPARRRRCGAGVQSGEGDLVVTDVVMPDENAFELLPRIKKLRPELPIIVMSAQNTFMTAIRASERGHDHPAEALRPEGAGRHRRARHGRAAQASRRQWP